MELIRQLQERIPAWQGYTPVVTPLAGGITNVNYRVDIGDESYVVRVCAQGVAIHGIDRQVEQQCAQAAAGIGVAPEVIGFFADLPGGEEVLVTRYIAGATLQAEAVRSSERLPQVADAIKRYHGLQRFAGHFNVFRLFARCLDASRRMGSPLPPEIDRIAAELGRIEAACKQRPTPLAACHNDLLAANWIEDAGGKLWLLDWEYAGWGDPFFDLGNLAVNNEFTAEHDAALLETYLGRVDAAGWARLQLMKIVSDAREGIWAYVQWGISSLEFDFAVYGERHLRRFLHNCARPEVSQWLRDVAPEA